VKRLNLANLQHGLPAITPAYGAVLAEAAAVCLTDQGHTSGTQLEITGDLTESCELFWPEVSEQMRLCWNDLEYSTEQGAYAIALLLVGWLTDFTVIRRSRKGTGYDYLLGYVETSQGDNYLRGMARLEVSGIRSGTTPMVKSRVKLKLEQVKPTDGILPAYIVVVEFSGPLAQVVRK
jgi:hypothetical protein